MIHTETVTETPDSLVIERPFVSGWSHATLPTGNHVHVWTLPLTEPALPLELLRSYLSPDEQQRAQRHVYQRDRDQFVSARGYMRAILSAYVDCSPRDVAFNYGLHGKPRLAGLPAATRLTFNLSHTRGLGLLAVARARQLGVDIEQIRPDIDILGISRTSFSSYERACLESLKPHDRVGAFYNCWTRKEAYLKARGEGLGYPLDAFDVSIAPGEPAELLRSSDGPAEQHRWSVHSLRPPEGYAAALVVES